MSIDLVAINGEFFKPEDAKISVFDRGFLFGDAVYEVTRSYGRILFKLEEHVGRLFRSASMINMDLQKNEEQVIEDLYRVYKKVDKDNKYIRVQVTRGEGPIGMASNLAAHRNWVVYVKDVDVVAPELYKNGITIVTSQRLRNTRAALDPNIKSGNYLNNVLAFQEAMPKKAFETIMVDKNGYCTEGTTSNIFCIKKGVVLTPPQSSDILRGITRSCLFEIAKENGIEIQETNFTSEELRSADEAFITSSTREVLPVSLVDNSKVSVGPVTQKLAQLYKKHIADYCEWAQKKHPWR